MQILKEAGLPDVRLLSDGIFTWFQLGYPVDYPATAAGGPAAIAMSEESLFSVLSWSENYPVLRDIRGSDTGEVFAAGDAGTILRYDGFGWVQMETCTAVNLNALWGISATEMYAAGDNGVVVRYGDTGWQTVTTGINGNIMDIWGNSSADIFLAGEEGLYHFDGLEWKKIDTGDDSGFTRIWGTSSDTIYTIDTDGCIWHFEGYTCSKIEMPQEIAGYGYTDIWGSSGDSVYAVGDNIIHFDGSAWRFSFADYNDSQSFTAIKGNSETDIVVVGNRGRILGYNGTSWEITDNQLESCFVAVWTDPSGLVFILAEESGKGTIYLYHE